MSSPLRQRMREHMKLRNLAEHTISAYELHVFCLARHFNQSPDRLTPEQVRAYILHEQVDRQLASSTINVLCSALRLFYAQVIDRADVIAVIPQVRRTEKHLPEVLTEAEVSRVIAAAELPKHRTLLMTAYGTGMRASEVVRFRPEQIDRQRLMIRIENAKGRKDRYTILPQRLLAELETYWRTCRPAEWFFPGANQGTPLAPRTATRIFNRAKALAGIRKGRGIHCLRHCFATHLLDHDVDILTIQWMLGHTSLSTTSRYLHITARGLHKIHSPLDSMPLD